MRVVSLRSVCTLVLPSVSILILRDWVFTFVCSLAIYSRPSVFARNARPTFPTPNRRSVSSIPMDTGLQICRLTVDTTVKRMHGTVRMLPHHPV